MFIVDLSVIVIVLYTGTCLVTTLEHVADTDNAFSEQNEINDERKKEYLIKENEVKKFCDIILKPVKYSKVNIYNKICTIDLIAFNQNDEISVTNCSHGFHFNCIRKYLLENVNKKKVICCPNCGHPILYTS